MVKIWILALLYVNISTTSFVDTPVSYAVEYTNCISAEE